MNAILKALCSSKYNVISVLSFVVVFTAFLTILDAKEFSGIDENDDKNFGSRIFNRFYFVCTTLSTAGYGDIYPKSMVARTTVVLMLFVIMTELMSKFSFELQV